MTCQQWQQRVQQFAILSPTMTWSISLERSSKEQRRWTKPRRLRHLYPYPQIWTYHGTIDDLYLHIQIERMINATLVPPIHFTGFEKQETSNGPEYLFYGSNCINYYRDVHENVISSYYRNIPDHRPLDARSRPRHRTLRGRTAKEIRRRTRPDKSEETRNAFINHKPFKRHNYGKAK